MSKTFMRPLTLSVVLLLVFLSLRLSPGLRDSLLLRYVLFASLVCLSVVLVRALNVLLLDIVFRRTRGRPAPALLGVVNASVAYAAILPLLYSQVFQKSITLEVLTTSAALSVVLGLALQDTLGNVFAGLSLQIEQPYHIGDVIRLRNVFGAIETVTWRSTSIRTNDNTLVMFPNSIVAREMVEILPQGHLNRRVLQFPVPYAITPETVLPLVREAVITVPNVAVERLPVVRIAGFTASHITYEVLYWVKDYMLAVDMDARMRERIWYAFHRHGLRPLPLHRVLYEAQEPVASRASIDYQALVRQVDLFTPLSPREQEALLQTRSTYAYAPGERILRCGEPGDSMFLICRGVVEVRVPVPDGDQHQVAVLGPGDYIGEMALFTGEARRADVYALEETEVLEIRKASLEVLLSQNTKLAEAFSHTIAERQGSLAAHAQLLSTAAQDMHPATILARMKHFFGLEGL
ncbi:MAG: cyclic nucleotide-binding domain-containing protein [Candidatus Tectimicrobiota bacterium]